MCRTYGATHFTLCIIAMSRLTDKAEFVRKTFHIAKGQEPCWR